MERKKFILVDYSYSYNVYVGGVGVSLQRNCLVRLRSRYYRARLKADQTNQNHDFGSLAFVLFLLSLLISKCVEIS